MSFSVTFADWEARDEAREVLEGAGVLPHRQCLLPFRITGNIDWACPRPTWTAPPAHGLVLAREPLGAHQLHPDRP